MSRQLQEFDQEVVEGVLLNSIIPVNNKAEPLAGIDKIIEPATGRKPCVC